MSIRRASGTTDPEVFEKILSMLDEINEAGRDDLARMIASGQMQAVVLWNAYRRQGLSLKLSPERSLVVKAAVEKWLEKAQEKRKRDPLAGLEAKTCEDYQYCFNALLAGQQKATAAELPALLQRYKEKAKGRMFNLTRSAVQAFIRDNVTDGRYSELWLQVSKVETRTVRRKKGNPQPPDRARLIAEQLGVYGSMWWTMCATGMGNKEYFETPWKVYPGYIHISGTKREFRDRNVPRIVTPVRPMCHEKTFEVALKQAIVELNKRDDVPEKFGRVTIYDARRTFAHWMESCRKIVKSRRDIYLGHAPADESALYEDHDASYYLAADRAALLEYVGAAPKFMRALA